MSTEDGNKNGGVPTSQNIEPDDMMVAILQSMGYPDKAVRRALKETSNDVQRAAELLMNPNFTAEPENANDETALSADAIPGAVEAKEGDVDEEALLSQALALSVAEDNAQVSGADDRGEEVSDDAVETHDQLPTQHAPSIETNILREVVDPQSTPESASACALVNFKAGCKHRTFIVNRYK